MKKLIISVFLLLVLSLLICSCSTSQVITERDYYFSLAFDKGKVYSPDADYVVCIEKQSDRDFIILNLTDIQIDSGKDISEDAKTVISNLVYSQHPDLITITGDQTYGNGKTLKSICDYIESFNIPWAPVFGNHDHEQRSISIEDQCTLFESYPNCLFRKGPQMGKTGIINVSSKAGNYIICVVEKDDDSFKVVKALFMLDTGSNKSYRFKDQKLYNFRNYDNLNSTQLKFYSDSIASLQKYGKVSSAIFVHMPFTAYEDAIREALITNNKSLTAAADSISYKESFNPNLWNDGFKDSFGVMHESCCCSPYNDGIFEVIKDNTDLVVAGHDHLNNFVINYQGVTLCYSMKTGKGCYYEKGMSGGTIIKLSSNGSCLVNHIIN